MSKYTKEDKAKALENLNRWMPPGATVYTILRHVSQSGMSRDISLVVVLPDGGAGSDRVLIHPNWAVACVLGARLVSRNGNDAIRQGGCGMDMGFHIVNTLSYILHGYPGDRAMERALPEGMRPGYTLRHEWL